MGTHLEVMQGLGWSRVGSTLGSLRRNGAGGVGASPENHRIIKVGTDL